MAHRDAVVPTMVFLSRYVVGGVARNVQGNEDLALLPIPFQLPVVGAQEKEGREARVVAGGRARPQCRQQQHGQDQSPRRPAAALHAAALRAAARPARSLIQFWSHAQGRRAGRGLEPSGSGQPSPRGKLAGDRSSRSYFGPQERQRSAGPEPRARRAVSSASERRRLCVRDAPRPGLGKLPPPPHLLKAPGATPSPRRRHTCPSRAPAPAPVPAPRAPLAPLAGARRVRVSCPRPTRARRAGLPCRCQATSHHGPTGRRVCLRRRSPGLSAAPFARMRGEAEGGGDCVVLCLH